MALDSINYPQDQIGIWGYDYLLQEDNKTFCGFFESNNCHQYLDEQSAIVHANNYSSSSSVIMNNVNKEHWGTTTSSPDDKLISGEHVAVVGRRKRRRTAKSGKNKQELENQRMTHITVERNRRKQMNEYLAVIRSLMPSSYVQRGDQASIVGGAINFVKELEQQLQTLQVQKRAMHQQTDHKMGNSTPPPPPPPPPFCEFFTFPQYSTTRSAGNNETSGSADNRPPAMAEIEVTMVESHANLKILSKKRNSQLLKMVAGLQCLWLTILHLNVTTLDEMVLYTLSVKLEDGCQLSTVDDIADAVNCLLARIGQEAL